jgi:UDP-2,4-diacetamido-2,4,6-trideoxy-beta-L-altropyranose hydrolase
VSGSPLLRRATEGDAEPLLAWRNHPETRAASFQQDPIELDEHRAWLAQRLGDPDCLLFVIEPEGAPSGSVRLERESDERAEIHIVVAPEASGKGLATLALREASELAEDQLGVRLIRARVKAENESSVRAFRAAGFEQAEERDGVIELTRPAGSIA